MPLYLNTAMAETVCPGEVSAMSDCEYRYGSGQPLQPAVPGRRGTPHMDRIYLPQLLPLEEYEKIIVLFPAGKTA